MLRNVLVELLGMMRQVADTHQDRELSLLCAECVAAVRARFFERERKG